MKEFQSQVLRRQTVRLTCRLLAPLLDSGLVTATEYSIIQRNLNSLVKNGELQPAMPVKLITPQEAAEMLAISYSQFRALEKEGIFPFQRKLIGGKTVRFRNLDVINYIMEENQIPKKEEAE